MKDKTYRITLTPKARRDRVVSGIIIGGVCYALAIASIHIIVSGIIGEDTEDGVESFVEEA